MISNTRVLAGTLLAGALLLSGCSDDSVASHMDSMENADEGASFNDADVTFAQGMIPHHEQAVQMAEMAEERAEDPRVLDLAGRIEAAQQPEIDTLTGWLQEWGVDDSGTGMDHGGMDHGGGMMSEDDMRALEGADGEQFDRHFLEMMIEHHTGAVEMAETEIDDGQNPDAITLAETIRDTQNAEIQEMEQLLTDLGG